MDTIGQRIRDARTARKLTQSGLARAVDITESQTVSNWERGVQRPGLQTVDRIAAALDVSPAWLLTGEGRGPAAVAPSALGPPNPVPLPAAS